MVDLNQELGLMTEAEYQKFRGFKSVQSARNERARGIGPAYVKLGKEVRYPIAAVKAYVAANTIKPGAPTLATGSRAAPFRTSVKQPARSGSRTAKAVGLMRMQIAAPVQLDILGTNGRARGAARTLLAQLDKLARFHDSQRHYEAVISLTMQQANQLSKSLRLSDGPMRWRGHPVRIVEDL